MSEVRSEFARFFNPVLEALRELGTSGRPKEVCRLISERMELPGQELAKTLKDGTSKFENLVAWARFYLMKTGYIDGSVRGVWRLTEKGKSAALSESEIRQIIYDVGQATPSTQHEKERLQDDSPAPSANKLLLDDHRVRLGQLLHELPPHGFENLCKRLLREAGFQEVTITGKSGDGGIDGNGILQINPLLSMKVLFQCKRYTGSVGSPEIRNFQAAVLGRADKGIFLTTGTFTADAQGEAARDGAVQIELIDLDRLINLFEELELGLSKETVYVIKEEFFEDFKEELPTI